MQLFFVSGYNKSGTTFLQMLLDAHPRINCPTEQHFKSLWDGLETLSHTYKKALEFFDTRTAKQGIRFDETFFAKHLFAHGLVKLSEFGANEQTTHFGLNDNSLVQRVDRLTALFPMAKFIFIIRDPRDVGVSIWHHRMRTEPDFADKGRQLDEMILRVCRGWPNHVGKILALQDKEPGSVHIVRYEDLISPQRDGTMVKMLSFMNIRAEIKTIAHMFAATDFEMLKEKERSEKVAITEGGNEGGLLNTGYFYSGKRGSWKEVLSDAQKAKAVESSRAMLEKFGYDHFL